MYLGDEGDIEDPAFCSPLVFASMQHKPRLCFDGGVVKAVEAYSWPCKLEDIPKILPNILKNDKLTKLDDRRGFHHVLVHPASRILTTFRFQNSYFHYRGLPFGVPSGPAVYQRANFNAVNFLRHFNVRTTLYLDDRLFLNRNSKNNFFPRDSFLGVILIIASGTFLSLSKSTFEASEKLEYLGMNINTSNYTFSKNKAQINII